MICDTCLCHHRTVYVDLFRVFRNSYFNRIVLSVTSFHSPAKALPKRVYNRFNESYVSWHNPASHSSIITHILRIYSYQSSPPNSISDLRYVGISTIKANSSPHHNSPSSPTDSASYSQTPSFSAWPPATSALHSHPPLHSETDLLHPASADKSAE